LLGDLRGGKGPKRIYVERGFVRNRRLLNEDALMTFLAGHGFERLRMDGLSVSEQARTFANAEAIVAVHGAALTNLVFAAPGAKVVEIFPPGIVEVSYFAAATHGSLEYFYVVGEPGPSKDDDFAIDIKRMAALFDAFSI
jgi:capsular polysaccharide biosynthesis protein